MHLAHYLGLLHKVQVDLAAAYREVGQAHRDEPDVRHLCRTLTSDCDDHAQQLAPFAERYGEDAPDEPDRLHAELFSGTREGPIGLLRDLHDLHLMAAQCDMAWTLIGQAAQGARDEELYAVVQRCEGATATQITRAAGATPSASAHTTTNQRTRDPIPRLLRVGAGDPRGPSGGCQSACRCGWARGPAGVTGTRPSNPREAAWPRSPGRSPARRTRPTTWSGSPSRA